MIGKIRDAFRKERGEAAAEADEALVDILAPSSFVESERALEVGKGVRQISWARDYDAMLDINWGRVLFERPGGATTFLCRPSDRASLAKRIDNSDARQGVTLVHGGSASDIEAAERSRAHGRSMLRIMGDSNEAFFDTVVLQTEVADDEAALRAGGVNLSGLAAGARITLECCTRKQREAFLAAGPFWVGGDEAWRRWGRDVCCSTLAASLPLQDNSLDDGSGTIIGFCEPDESMARIDTLADADERPNHNVVITGQSGSGKTYLAQKILLSEWAQGARIVVIDPERQFRGMCKSAGGDWVNAGGGVRRNKKGSLVGACFSPLQPRLGNFDVDDLREEDGSLAASGEEDQEVLRATLAFFHGWAELAWLAAPDDTPLLDHGLVAAYARYGIDFSTTAEDLEPDRYPTMEDLKQCFEDLAQKARFKEDAATYRRFALKCEQCCEDGLYGNLWAHRTNVSVASDFLVFDVHELMEAEDHIRTAQLFSILSWIWSQMALAPRAGKFLRIFADEGHLLYNVNEKASSKVAAAYVNMIQKRVRKLYGGLMFATQQLADALSDDVRRYGEALVTSSCYKFFFSTGGTDLKELVSVMGLTPTIEQLVGTRFNRGDCLMFAHNARAQVHVEACQAEEAFFAGPEAVL